MSSEAITRNDLTNILNKVLPCDNNFVIDTATKSSVSINAQGNVGDTISVTKVGYYPIGIVGYNSSSTYCAFGRLYLSNRASGSCTVNYGLNNASSSTRSTNLTIYILWIKE